MSYTEASALLQLHIAEWRTNEPQCRQEHRDRHRQQSSWLCVEPQLAFLWIPTGPFIFFPRNSLCAHCVSASWQAP